MTLTNEEIKKSANWSEPVETQTKRGPRMLSKAAPTPEFSELWKTRKEECKALGAGFSKNFQDEWELTWWQPLPEKVQQERAEAVEQSKAASADIDLPRPEGLNYMPFQMAGIRYALSRPNVLIADEMGLGKTIQSIGIVNADPTIKRVLVICPKSLKINWKREWDKWNARDLTIGVANGSWPDTDVVILNYESLDKWIEQTRAIEWDVLILDEAHYIKNAKTKRSQLIKGRAAVPANPKKNQKEVPALAPIRAKRHIRLTGTPIVNRPIELYNIVSDLTPVFGSFHKFAYRYAGATQSRFGLKTDGATRLDELQRRLRETVMVRRLKADVLTELPRKIRQIVEIEAENADQRKAVQAEQSFETASESRLAELRALVELSKAESEEAYKTAVARLVDATQVDFTEMARLRYETAMAKVPAVIAHVQNALEDGDNKIILAAHHHDVHNALMEGLKKYNPVLLTGEQNEKDRTAAVDKFQADPTCRVFVGSIKAAGVGITLTASSHVIFAELDWTPGAMSQMEDRAHRIGQTETVLVQHIVLVDSIDCRMAQKLVAKQEIIDKALDKELPEAKQSVYEPKVPATTSKETVQTVAKEAEELTTEQVKAIHEGLRILAGMDWDGARELNDVGFSKVDTEIGRSLAAQLTLSPKQAVLGKKLVNKYRRQLPDEIKKIVGIEEKK